MHATELTISIWLTITLFGIGDKNTCLNKLGRSGRVLNTQPSTCKANAIINCATSATINYLYELASI